MSLPARLRPTHIAVLLPWIVVVVAARLPVRDNSFLWHVRAGSLQIDGSSVLTTDPFSWALAGSPWRTQSWLAELGYGWLEAGSGLAFVPWMVAFAGLAVVAAVMVHAAKPGGSVLTVALLGIGTAWVAASFLNPRPVLLSYVLLAMVVLASGRSRLRWALPLLVWLWAGVHASFVLAFVFVAANGLRRREKAAWTDLVAMAAVLPFTAHGVGLARFLVEFVSTRDALGYLSEWRTPSFTSVAFALVVPAVLLVIAGAARGAVTTRDLWLIGPVLLFMASASRSVFPAWLMLSPLLAVSLDSLLAGRSLAGVRASRRIGRVDVALMSVLAAGVVVLPFLLEPSAHGLDEERFPLLAAAHLDGERIYADDVAGGYLIYASGPDRLVYVDDRAELYGADYFAEAVSARAGGQHWRTVFERWAIDQALVRTGDGLLEVLKAEGWTERHRDEWFVVLDRS